MKNSITHVAMDTHKKEHTVAVGHAETGKVAVFTVRNTVKDIGRMVKKLQKQAAGPPLHNQKLNTKHSKLQRLYSLFKV